MKKIVIAIALAVTTMSASAVQCIVNMKNGTSYNRNQTNCVTTQYANALPIGKQIKNLAIIAGVAYLLMSVVDHKKADRLMNSFNGEDEGPIEYIPFEGQQVTSVPDKALTEVVTPKGPTCSPGLWGRFEGDRWVCN
jgi:hypothetical protein